MTSKAEKDRQKQIQDKCQQLLNQMLRDEDNKYCVDCDAKGPRWASWNLGVFLCIRCAGIHRNLGVHISRVKSVNLDTWTPEQVVSLQQMGNSRARAVYEANLPDTFRRPQTDSPLETFVRAKYEHKKYIAREWVPSPLPKVNWDKELDEEAEQQRRRRKDQKSSGTPQATRAATSSPSISSEIPAPLPKPKCSASPKVLASSSIQPPEIPATSNTLDLFGLDTPSGSSSGKGGDDIFSGFLSAPPAAPKPDQVESGKVDSQANNDGKRSEEEDNFFNQPAPSTQEKRQLTKDSILALYSSMPSAPPPSQPIQNQAQPFVGMQGGVFGGGSNVFPQAPVGQPVGMNMGMVNGAVSQVMPSMPPAQNGMFGAMPTGVAPVPAMLSNPFYNMPAFANPLPSQNMLPVQNQELGSRNDLVDVSLSTPQLVNQVREMGVQGSWANKVVLPQQMSRLNMSSGAPFSSLPPQPTIPVQNVPQGMSANPWGSVPSGGLGQNPFPVQGQAPMGHTLATNLWQ